jgi:hypothetical protein
MVMAHRPKLLEVLSKLELHPAPGRCAMELAYLILKRLSPSDQLAKEAIRQFENNYTDTDALSSLRTAICGKRALSNNAIIDPLYHLTWCLLPSEDELTGYDFGFYLAWADQLGISESDVLDAYEKLSSLP